jgi:hypothetical protein
LAGSPHISTLFGVPTRVNDVRAFDLDNDPEADLELLIVTGEELRIMAIKAHLDQLAKAPVTGADSQRGSPRRALRLEYDDVDDPVTEVPAPEGATADVMGMVDRRKRD